MLDLYFLRERTIRNVLDCQSIRPFNQETDLAEADRIDRDHYLGIEKIVSPLESYFQLPEVDGFVQNNPHFPGKLNGFLLYTKIGHLRGWYDEKGERGSFGKNKPLWESAAREKQIEYPQPTDLVILSCAVDKKDSPAEDSEERKDWSAALLNLGLIGRANALGLAIVTYNWDKDLLLRGIYKAYGYTPVCSVKDYYTEGEHLNIFIRKRKSSN